MARQDDTGPSAKERAAQQREDRLRKQLRANLQRRKAQARSRAEADKADETKPAKGS